MCGNYVVTGVPEKFAIASYLAMTNGFIVSHFIS